MVKRKGWHTRKTDKQLEDYLRSANPKDIFYYSAVCEKEYRIKNKIWTRK